jgi:hypothetical protein
MLIYPQGTAYDHSTMESVAKDGENDLEDLEGRTVFLCLEAAIFSYARKALVANSTIREALIPSNNFVEKEEKDRVGILPVVKSVVILSKV